MEVAFFPVLVDSDIRDLLLLPDPLLYLLFREMPLHHILQYLVVVLHGSPMAVDSLFEPHYRHNLLPFGVFHKEICEHEEQKQLVMVTTSSNVSALRASFSVVNIIAKVKKPFTPTEESILPVPKDSFHELLGEAAVQKVAPFPLLASTIAK